MELLFKEAYDCVAAFATQWIEGQTVWITLSRKRTVSNYSADVLKNVRSSSLYSD
jgi:hypothetical protein